MIQQTKPTYNKNLYNANPTQNPPPKGFMINVKNEMQPLTNARPTHTSQRGQRKLAYFHSSSKNKANGPKWHRSVQNIQLFEVRQLLARKRSPTRTFEDRFRRWWQSQARNTFRFIFRLVVKFAVYVRALRELVQFVCCIQILNSISFVVY